jgi:hypothetical protein
MLLHYFFSVLDLFYFSIFSFINRLVNNDRFLILGKEMTANFETVPVVDVHKENIKTIWPSLMLALKSATYVAIDTVSQLYIKGI